MNGIQITCATCHLHWSVAINPSVYSQQALESCPCPRCGAYTLACQASADADAHRRQRHFHAAGIGTPFNA